MTCVDPNAVFTMSALAEVIVTCNCSSTDCDWISDVDSTGIKTGTNPEIIPMEDFDDWKCIVLPSAEEAETLAQEAAAVTAPTLAVAEVSMSINEPWSESLNDKNSQEYKDMLENVLTKLNLEVGGDVNGLPIGSLDVEFSQDEATARLFDFGGILLNVAVGIITKGLHELVDTVQEGFEDLATEITNSQIFQSVSTGISNTVVGMEGTDDGWAAVREASK